MSKLKCVLMVLVLACPAFAQKLTGRLGNPARPFSITAEIHHEGSFELQRSVGSLTNWLAFTNFNSFLATNAFADSRTNKESFYRLVRLNIPPAITTQPAGATNFAGTAVQLQGAASGSWPLRFQWFKGVEPIPGATSNKLALAGHPAESGNYHLVASNSWGVALSAAAPVKIVNPVATNIAGRKIRYVVRSGQGLTKNGDPVPTSGSFEATYSSLGSYSATSSNILLNDQGYWQYASSSTQPLGRILMSASFVYPEGTVNDLAFTNETSGTYLIQVPNSPARQSGDFTILAPP